MRTFVSSLAWVVVREICQVAMKASVATKCDYLSGYSWGTHNGAWEFCQCMQWAIDSNTVHHVCSLFSNPRHKLSLLSLCFPNSVSRFECIRLTIHWNVSTWCSSAPWSHHTNLVATFWNYQISSQLTKGGRIGSFFLARSVETSSWARFSDRAFLEGQLLNTLRTRRAEEGTAVSVCTACPACFLLGARIPLSQSQKRR